MTETKLNPKFHPLANAFPLIADDSAEFAELVKDIAENGLTEPVVMYEGKILDGRNRWRACQHLGLPHREVQFDQLKYGSDDPVAFVWSKNAMRRHLEPAQKAMAAAELATYAPGSNQHKKINEGDAEPDGGITVQQAADMAGVDPTSVKRARRIKKTAVPEVTEAVKKGDLPLRTAERIAAKPEEEQKAIMATSSPDEIAKAVRPERPTPVPEAVQMDSTFQEPVVTPVPEPVADTKGNKRRPATIMREQMVKHYLVASMIPLEYWAAHQADIGKINKNELSAYVKDLKAVRTEITRMLKLIDSATDL